MTSAQKKRRVAILGGGTGAVSTAFYMSNTAEKREQFEVTIYQIGWRLGGKGASSRDPRKRGRNIEHGLHVFAGFYDNAFGMLNDCYAEWAKISDQAFDIRDAFIGHDSATLERRSLDGWHHLDVNFPLGPGYPGFDPDPLTPGEMVTRILNLLVRRTVGFLAGEWSQAKPGSPSAGPAFLIRQALKLLRSFIDDYAGKIEPPNLLSIPPARALLCKTLKALLTAILAVEPLAPPPQSSDGDPLLDALALVVAIGVIEDRLFERGFEAVDDVELSTWMRRHGATDKVIDSAYLRGGYDYAFAYAGGKSQPAPDRSIAAGVALRAFIRQHFTYHGSFFYHLNGGMGEIVFTPLYEVLKWWGVSFSFFHRVDSLRLSDDGRLIAGVGGVLQAEPTGDSYDPLVEWNNRKAWPRRPSYDQLKDGEKLARWDDDLESWAARDHGEPRFALERGRDFDEIVLAIPISALDGIADELRARHPKWGAAIDNASTIPTVTAQLWLGATKDGLGQKGSHDLITAYAEPFNTWADMSFLLGQEEASEVRQLSYLCGPWPATPLTNDKKAQQLASRALAAWLDQNAAHIMPIAVDPRTGRFDASLILDQYVHAHLNPSDHYILSPPGSIRHRIPSADTGIENLCVAGDWTRNGLDVGCFEAAVMSGKQCARWITGDPLPVYGEPEPRL